MANSNRGNEPTNLTKFLLCSRAAGRCQFCNKELFVDSFTLKDDNNSNLAHIIASSPDGPRGDAVRSFQESDKIENLMLMCLEHHHLIDENEDIYTEEVLKEMKESHERKVRELVGTLDAEETEILLFMSKIKNRIDVNITPKQAVQAFIGSKRPYSLTGTKIEPKSNYDYKSKEYWKQQIHTIDCLVTSKINNIKDFNPQISFSIFPLAPIPLISYMGYKLGDKMPIDVYQKFRNPDTWKWQSLSLTNEFFVNKKIISDGNKIALVISLTNDIVDERVLSVYDCNIIYSISAYRLGVDCIKSAEDLSAFWHAYQQSCDQIKRDYPDCKEISVFPAMPVSAAFEIGRRYMEGVYPKLKIFDDDNGFFETIIIGGE